MHVRSSLHQRLRHLHVALPRRAVQRRVARLQASTGHQPAQHTYTLIANATATQQSIHAASHSSAASKLQ